jgi:hypothetical protein
MDKDFTARRYGYGLLERALGAALDADEEVQRGALRSRIKRLARLGLPAPLPEEWEGSRAYSLEEVHQILIAILMEDAGLDPTVVARAVKKAWVRNLADAKNATSTEARTKNPIILFIMLQAVRGPWRTGNPHDAVPLVYLKPRSDRRSFGRYVEFYRRYFQKQGLDAEDAKRMAELMAEWKADQVTDGFDHAQKDEGWFAACDYTAIAIKLEDVLKEGK